MHLLRVLLLEQKHEPQRRAVGGRELERLYKEGFYVFHDWDTGRGNVDHFAIGPQGVFAVETKALKGEATCEGGRLLQDSRHIPGRDVAKQASGGAAAVNGPIRKPSGLGPWVHAIVCFGRAEVSCYGSIGKVEITNPGSLNKTIVNRSKLYSPENVEEIADLLEKNIGVSPAAAPGSPPEKTGRITAFFAEGRNLVVALLCFMLLVSLAFAGTTADFPEHVTGTYRSIEAIGN